MEENKKGKTIFKRISNTIFYILVALAYVLSFQGIQINRSADYIPSIFGNTYLNILSDSMVPEFKATDLILGKISNDKENYEVGDIITFKKGRMLVTHRIIKVLDNGKSYITQGDANEVADDDAVLAEKIVSKCYLSIPYAGQVVAKFQNYMFLAILWATAMYFIVKEIIIEAKNMKNTKKITECNN